MCEDIEQYLDDALSNIGIVRIDEQTTTDIFNLAQKIFYRECKQIANRTNKSRAEEEKWKKMMIKAGQYSDYVEQLENDTPCVFVQFGGSR